MNRRLGRTHSSFDGPTLARMSRILTGAVAIVMLALSEKAVACSCAQRDDELMIASSDVAFRGQVLDVEPVIQTKCDRSKRTLPALPHPGAKTGCVGGFVTDQGECPVAGEQVLLRSSEDLLVRLRTSDDGWFSQCGLSPGDYELFTGDVEVGPDAEGSRLVSHDQLAIRPGEFTIYHMDDTSLREAGPHRATFRVLEAHKGCASGDEVTLQFSVCGESCGITVEAGETWDVFARKRAAASETTSPLGGMGEFCGASAADDPPGILTIGMCSASRVAGAPAPAADVSKAPPGAGCAGCRVGALRGDSPGWFAFLLLSVAIVRRRRWLAYGSNVETDAF